MIRENYVSLRRSGVYIVFSETMEDSQIEIEVDWVRVVSYLMIRKPKKTANLKSTG